MESEWRVYLREHAPELYEQMLQDVRWAAQWRDEQIERLERERDELRDINKAFQQAILDYEQECDTLGKGQK